jgi:YVTN family beta-propeller protein
MAIDGDVMWVTDQNKDQGWRVNIETNKTIGKPIDEVGDQPDGVAAKSGTVWVANSDDSVTRLKLSDDGTVTPKNIDLEDPKTKPEGLALSGQWVWVATNESYVARIDRASATLQAPIEIGKGTVAVFVDEDEDGVYVSDNGGHTVTRLDPDTGEKMWGEPTTVGHKPRGLVKADGSIWVANSKDNTVSRLSSATGEVLRRRIRVGENPRDVTYAGGFIWVANTSSNTVTKIDPRSESVVDEIPVGTTPASIVAGAGSVWVSNSDDGTLTRIEP